MNQWKMQEINFTEDSLITCHYYGTKVQTCCAVLKLSTPTKDNETTYIYYSNKLLDLAALVDESVPRPALC